MQYTRPEQEWRQKVLDTINQRGPISLDALTNEIDIPLGSYHKRRFVEVNANLLTVKRTVAREGKGTKKNPFHYSSISQYQKNS